MIKFKDAVLEEKIKKVEDYAIQTIRMTPNLENTMTNIETFDSGVYEHSKNVCHIAVALGLAYNFNLHELINLAVGGFLHDIGKIYLNKDILYKPSRLDADERIFVETHVNFGYKIVKNTQVDQMVLDICKYHHEKLNGLGYPDGLRGNNISIFVQLVTIADIFDALTSERCYKEAFPIEHALVILKNDSGLNQVAVSILQSIIENNL